MKEMETRLTEVEKVVQEIINRINNKELKWASLREKWTMTVGVLALVVFFLIIIVATISGQLNLMNEYSTTFNAFIMAVLGYLFGYVPAKSSEEFIKGDKEVIEEKLGKVEMALDEYIDILTSKEIIIKDYEKIVELYET